MNNGTGYFRIGQAEQDTRHCSGCGAENPSQEDGYTECCNKRICYGGSQDCCRGMIFRNKK